MLYKETVAERTLDLIRRMMKDNAFNDFNLVGGTALSLQIGHRISEDIDLFNQNPFDSLKLATYLQQEYNAENTKTLKNGVFCFVGDIKLDMLAHQYPLIKPIVNEDGIRMVSLDDIGAMKLNVITDKGTRLKDFIDMYALLEHRALKEMLAGYEKKYPDVSSNIAVKALNYHQDIQPATIHFIGPQISKEQMAERIYQATIEPSRLFKSGIKEQQSLQQSLEIKHGEHLKPQREKLKKDDEPKQNKGLRPKL